MHQSHWENCNKVTACLFILDIIIIIIIIIIIFLNELYLESSITIGH